jgi:hypothetical protein
MRFVDASFSNDLDAGEYKIIDKEPDGLGQGFLNTLIVIQ